MNGKYLIVLIISLSGLILAESGFYFLRTEMTAQEISTAQTSYMFSNSVENTGLNPASAIGEDRFTAAVSYRTLFEDAEASRFSISYKENDHQYGLVFSALNISGLEGREVPSEEPLYEFGSNNIIVSGSYVYRFDSGIKFGVSGKYLFEKIEYEDSYGFAGSAGIFRECKFVKNLNIGLSVNNIGTMSRLDEEKTELPSDVLFGLGYVYQTAFNMDLKIANSTRYLLNDEETENFTGIELSYLKRFFLRSGFRAMNEGMPFSTGIGIIVDKFSFDYSFTPFSDEEGDNSHSMTLGYALK
jgi:hypothetical protein